MATYTKTLLSGSDKGKQIKVTGTDAAGSVVVHTAVDNLIDLDEIWIYAYNEDSATRVLTLLWGGTSETDNVMRFPIASQGGRILVVDGALLHGGLVVKAYGSVANKILVDGFVNSIVNDSAPSS